MTCVRVGSTASSIVLKVAIQAGSRQLKVFDRVIDIMFSLCLAFLLCNMRCLFRPIPNPFEPRDILFVPILLYIHALSNIVSLPDAHAFRNQREIIVFRYPWNLVISSACCHHWLVNLAFCNPCSCNFWWGLQAFLYIFCTFRVVIFSNIMSKALLARGDISVT